MGWDENEFRVRMEKAFAVRNEIFVGLAGADALIRHFDGNVPTFHDGEVEALHLSKRGPSLIEIRIGHPDIFSADHIFVTLTVAQVIDVDLDDFSPQNVIQELWLRRAVWQPDHPQKGIEAGEDGVEIELESIWGIGGTIVGKGLSVSWSKDPHGRG